MKTSFFLVCLSIILPYIYALQSLKIVEPDDLSRVYPPSGFIPELHLGAAMFGTPSYTSDIFGEVYIPYPSNACNPITSASPNITQGQSLIYFIDRGDCTFVTKVRNAENAGALGVIVANNVDIGNRRPPMMADDGKGMYVHIPSVLVLKQDADLMRTAIQAGKTVQVVFAWDLPNPDGTVEWEFWTSAVDDQSVTFKNIFGRVLRALGPSSSFQPHIYLAGGQNNGIYYPNPCRGKITCPQCTNTGRYCNINNPTGATGADVVRENLRSMCVWQIVNNTLGKPWMWFDYVSNFQSVCPLAQNKITLDCSVTVQKMIGLNPDDVNQCVTASGGSAVDGGENSIMESELAEMAWTLPTLMINDEPYYGGQCGTLPDGTVDVSHCGVLDAICSGLSNRFVVPACNTDPGCDITQKRNECGVCDGSVVIDACGKCLPVNSTSFNMTCAGCDGIPNSGMRIDPCGICGGANAVEDCAPSSGISITTVLVIGGVILAIVAVGVFFYMRRQKNKMKLDIDKLLQQYLPLEQANNVRTANGTATNGQHMAVNADEERLFPANTDSSTS